MWGGVSSMVSSAISINSKSRIFFTTLGGRDAAGLNGLGDVMGTVAVDSGALALTVALDAAVASSLRPEDLG